MIHSNKFKEKKLQAYADFSIAFGGQSIITRISANYIN